MDKTLACSHIPGYTDQFDGDDVRGQWLAALYDENIKRLAMGAIIIQQARDAVKEKTGFTCTAGIAHNKVNRVVRKNCWLLALRCQSVARYTHKNKMKLNVNVILEPKMR